MKRMQLIACGLMIAPTGFACGPDLPVTLMDDGMEDQVPEAEPGIDGALGRSPWVARAPRAPRGMTVRAEGSERTMGSWALWSMAGGDTSHDVITAVRGDGLGNVVTAGYFAGDIDLGCGVQTSGGVWDGFVAKHDGRGTCLWLRQIGGAGALTRAVDVAVGEDGAVYVTGVTYGAVSFPDGRYESAGGADVFLAKYSPDGFHVWGLGFGGPGDDYARAVSIRGRALYVGGVFQGVARIGRDVLSSNGEADGFVAAFADDGVARWSLGFGGSLSDAVNTVVATEDEVFAAGSFRGSVSFGGHVESSAGGGHDAFLVRLSSSGVSWVSTFGSTGWDSATTAAIDGEGDLRVAGIFGGTIDLGGGSLAAEGPRSGFVGRFTPAGKHVWSRRLHGGHQTSIESVDVGPGGETYAVGHEALEGPRNRATVFMVDADGAHLGFSGLRGLGASQAHDVALVDTGRLVVGGAFDEQVSIGSATHVSAGLTDALLYAVEP